MACPRRQDRSWGIKHSTAFCVAFPHVGFESLGFCRKVVDIYNLLVVHITEQGLEATVCKNVDVPLIISTPRNEMNHCELDWGFWCG